MLGWRGVIEEYRSYLPIAPGAPVVAMAFGPGLTLYACLLRWTEAGSEVAGGRFGHDLIISRS